MTEERKSADGKQNPDYEVEAGEVVEEELVGGAPVRRKGIYLLPNALTTASLFSGFYAIVSAANGVFDNAAIAIFVSMILDGLDGRVARMTNTQSKFGEEYDSLADMVAFGVAGYFLRKLEIPLVPIILGLLLGPEMEKNLGHALVLSDGEWSVLWASPLAMGLWIVAGLGLILPYLVGPLLRRRMNAAMKESPVSD